MQHHILGIAFASQPRYIPVGVKTLRSRIKPTGLLYRLRAPLLIRSNWGYAHASARQSVSLYADFALGFGRRFPFCLRLEALTASRLRCAVHFPAASTGPNVGWR